MLRKCLKYDLRAIGRLWWIVALSMVGAALVGGASVRATILIEEGDRFGFLSVFTVLIMVASVLALIAATVITEILIYWHFYKSFYTDEGYLTFTLPVSRRTLFLSKTLNALIWSLAQVFLLFLCILLFLLIGAAGQMETHIWKELGYSLREMWRGIGGWSIVLALEVVALILASELYTVSLIHFCITMGAMLAKKYKLLAAVGVYYVVNMVLTAVGQVAAVLFAFLVIDSGLFDRLLLASANVRGAGYCLLMLLICLASAVIAGVIYFITLGRLEKNLNLA